MCLLTWVPKRQVPIRGVNRGNRSLRVDLFEFADKTAYHPGGPAAGHAQRP